MNNSGEVTPTHAWWALPRRRVPVLSRLEVVQGQRHQLARYANLGLEALRI